MRQGYPCWPNPGQLCIAPRTSRSRPVSFLPTQSVFPDFLFDMRRKKFSGIQKYFFHSKTSLSEENRKVTRVDEEQTYPDHTERFENWDQVLCREGLTGRCYWEVEWMGHEVHIGVTYSGIGREGRGHDCGLGYNNKSWTLSCNNDIYTARYNKKPTTVPDHAFRSHRIGVYLDWPAGTLSFYSVSSDTMTHLHTFTSTFTEPLYPAFRIWYCGHISIVHLSGVSNYRTIIILSSVIC
uniref:B30.2/SPRY domain-containing protein n=1 Tax=Oncorhynchus tshawytscha TaxID=74940 RepID=A0AAZ3RS38_ONCTS